MGDSRRNSSVTALFRASMQATPRVMRRTLLTLLALTAGLAVLPSAAGAATVGVSDQRASTFSNPLFKPLKMADARYITPWDVMSSRSDRAALDDWLTAARKAKIKHILVSFEHSHRGSKATQLPSIAAYTSAL